MSRSTPVADHGFLAGRPPSFGRRSRYRYVRQVRGKTGIWVWQARVWLNEVVGHIHLGLYREERAAKSAVDGWIRAGADPCRGLPPGVLPKWVRKRPQDGLYDAIRRRRDGTRIPVAGGPWATPEAAHVAARAVSAREGRWTTGQQRRARAARWPARPGGGWELVRPLRIAPRLG